MLTLWILHQDPALRAATLSVDGASVTLGQGQAVGDVRVQLVLRDVVYVQSGSTVYSLRVR